jgi:hypothetical protein
LIFFRAGGSNNIVRDFPLRDFLLLERAFAATAGMLIHVNESYFALPDICKEHWLSENARDSCLRRDRRTIMGTFGDEMFTHFPSVVGPKTSITRTSARRLSGKAPGTATSARPLQR